MGWVNARLLQRRYDDALALIDRIPRDKADAEPTWHETELIYRAISLGAAAYLPKESSRDDICDAVAAVARGETRLSPEVQAELVRQIQMREVQNRPALSPREREVLTLIAEGLSVPDVAAALHLSPSTIKTHLQILYEKLGVSDRAASVATAMRRGLLE